MCVCVRASVRACVRVCVCGCVRVCVCVVGVTREGMRALVDVPLRSCVLSDGFHPRQFFLVRDAMRSQVPMFVVLENVVGLLRVWEQVRAHLKKCGNYMIHIVRINPKELGSPTARDRVYIFMVLREALDTESDEQAKKLIDDTLHSLKHDFKVGWNSLLFPESHRLVKAMRSQMDKKSQKLLEHLGGDEQGCKCR